MSDHFLRDESGKVRAVVSLANIYRYSGFMFEFHPFCGPCKVNRDFQPSKQQGMRFWRAFEAWSKLSDEKKRATKIFG